MNPEITLCTIIVFFASLVEASFGFGGGLIAIPLMSFLIGIQDSISLFLIFQFLKGCLLIPGWRHVAWRQIGLICIVLPLGVGLGVWFLHAFSFRWLEVLLGFYLLGFVACDTILKNRLHAPSSRPVQVLLGILGGFVQGIIGTGGPFLVTYVKSLGLTKDEFRFSLILLLFVANFVRMGLTVETGLFNNQVLTALIFCLPAYALALFVGYRLPKFLSPRQFSCVINSLLVVSGMSLLIKNL